MASPCKSLLAPLQGDKNKKNTKFQILFLFFFWKQNKQNKTNPTKKLALGTQKASYPLWKNQGNQSSRAWHGFGLCNSDKDEVAQRMCLIWFQCNPFKNLLKARLWTLNCLIRSRLLSSPDKSLFIPNSVLIHKRLIVENLPKFKQRKLLIFSYQDNFLQ